jgi:hypothetical protein
MQGNRPKNGSQLDASRRFGSPGGGPAPPSQKDRRVGRPAELDGRHVITYAYRMIAERLFGHTGTPSHRR